MDLDAATAALRDLDQPAYREAQMRRAVTRELIASWDEATTLPASLRSALAERAPVRELVECDRQDSRDGTIKARFETADGFPLETVLMRHGDRHAVCVSSQSGCALACAFCATGAMGFGRSLRAGEILEQLLWAARVARDERSSAIRNVVLMGMGEPLQNLDAVLDFCRSANDPDGFGLGARSIAISTAGWVPGIDHLATEPLQVKLAVSLHAPDDALRTRLMPVNRRYPIADLMAALVRYRETRRRRIYVEYLLLDGVNDEPAHASALAELLEAQLPGGYHINLIWYNPTGSDLTASAPDRVRRFRSELTRRGAPHSLRRSKGADIDAACGQLAVRGAVEARRARREPVAR